MKLAERKCMANFDQSLESLIAENVSDPAADAALEQALKIVPRGAFALAGLTLSLLLLAWLAVYFFVFLPRGPIS
ncbi:MAG: hypothetical protein WDN46_02935 [Methylocella sp.]